MIPGLEVVVVIAVAVTGVLVTLAQRVDWATSEVSEPPQEIILTEAILPAVNRVRTALLRLVALAAAETPTCAAEN